VIAGTDLAARLLDALPQTQCTRCGFADCRGYAEAMAAGDAGIGRCPPGGREGIDRLARITGRPAVDLDPACGAEGPRARAVIDEAACIGCALCLKACPVDAIVGAAKRMHTVVEPLCTGCDLCLPVCPVDCISMIDVSGERVGWAAWSEHEADVARSRYAAHAARLVALAAPARTRPEPVDRSEAVAAALARARSARSPG